ncbi:MAG: DUF4037 domain-containing protein [Clostridia bacterium]|nr:DUF4037 domain-containing protein [Clostridia bacterium]
MKGLELAKEFYKEFGEPMLKEKFTDIFGYLATGLVGSGSECFGYDDDISQDHDFEPAFCIFLPDESIIDRKTAFELERAYSALPTEYKGYKRSGTSAVGGNRHGVIRTSDFFDAKTGSPDGNLTTEQWLSLSDFFLAEAVNGEVFCDNYGEFTRIRESLKHYPQDIRLKKLAGNLLLMGQSGQYNYSRCIERGETAAAQLSLYEFVKSTINAIFLINKKYVPYYKWSFRALREISTECAEISQILEYLISSPNDESTSGDKTEIIEGVCLMLGMELKRCNITESASSETEQQAYAVNDRITDNRIRNMNILCAV